MKYNSCLEVLGEIDIIISYSKSKRGRSFEK